MAESKHRHAPKANPLLMQWARFSIIGTHVFSSNNTKHTLFPWCKFNANATLDLDGLNETCGPHPGQQYMTQSNHTSMQRKQRATISLCTNYCWCKTKSVMGISQALQLFLRGTPCKPELRKAMRTKTQNPYAPTF